MSEPALEIHLDADDLARTLRADVLTGLTASPKWLPPKWFYDARGSELFERITELREYYPTRTERQILRERAGEIARHTRARTLLELGSGYSTKTRLLLDALTAQGSLAAFVPMDVSTTALEAAAARITADYPGLRVHNIVGDLTRHLKHLPGGGDRLVAFLGGTIGNLYPRERTRFLRRLRTAMGPADRLVIGTDLVKDRAMLEAAYNDSEGVTAEFNRNVLAVLNRELGAGFDPATFEHVALWDAEAEWIEMRLRSTVEQVVAVPDLDLQVAFAAGEEMRTEVSAKFRPERVEAELAAAGLRLTDWWTDPAGDFGVSLSTPA